MDEGERDRLVEIQDGAVDDVFPGGILDRVEVCDGVAAAHTRCVGGSFSGNVIRDGGTVQELLHLVVEHGNAGHQAESEDKVGDRAGQSDQNALPARVRIEVAGIIDGRSRFTGVIGGQIHLAGHLDVATERDSRDLVLGIAAAEADEAFAEADGKDLDADAAELGDGEVAELMDENHDAEDEEKFDDCGHEVWGRPRYLMGVIATTVVRRWTDWQSLRAHNDARQDLLRALRG